MDEQGGPLAAVIDGANVPDTKLLDATLSAIVVDRPDPEDYEQHLCLDKGDDNPTGKAAVEKHQYVTCISFFGQSECLFWTRPEGASDGTTKSLGRSEEDASAASSVHGGVQV